MAKYRIVLELECESEKLVDEVVLDFEDAVWRDSFGDVKITKFRVIGEELEYKDVKII